MCWDTAEKPQCDVTPTSRTWPDYALALPQPRLSDLLSRKPLNKERQWRMSGFHPRPKSWVWSMHLHLGNDGKWSWVSELLVLCVACYNTYWKRAWILELIVQEKADILLSLYELVSEWNTWNMGREGTLGSNNAGLIFVFLNTLPLGVLWWLGSGWRT